MILKNLKLFEILSKTSFQALVVTGGQSNDGNLDTTEVFYGPNWRWITLTAKLPGAMFAHASVTVNNRVFTFGKKTLE